MPASSKYRLYEEFVQSPQWQTTYMPRFHKKLTGQTAHSMREDFCGTGVISCDWVKKSPRNRAVGLDLDPEPLGRAKTVHRAALPAHLQKQVSFLRQDVLVPTREKFDMIGAHNFSFYVFHERKELLRYARAARQSLKKNGTFFLEMAGGPGFVEAGSAPVVSTNLEGYGKAGYVWEQRNHDPLRATGEYAIHFRQKNGKWLRDAFVYDWRLWEIREVRELLCEAGFKKTAVLWQTDRELRNGTLEYAVTETGDFCEVWLAYVVGVK
jgi:SAM-dependent methyltransferase